MELNITQTQIFTTLDKMFVQQNITPLSLKPQQKFTTNFSEIGNLITAQIQEEELIIVFRDTLARILSSALNNFPDNIFWDLDFLVSSMLKQALMAERIDAFIDNFGDKIVYLMETFGRESEINFRYVHDFTYGYDWAKWVSKNPRERSHLEPFCLDFLDYLLTRGQEILYKISIDDAHYHRLQNNNYRNPFRFSREPEDERRLLTYLADNQLIPVATWNWNAQPTWKKPFHKIREQVSLQLNIPKNSDY